METHNTKEVEEVINEFKEKRKLLFTRGGLSVLLDYEPHDIVLDEKSVIEWLRTTLHHQLQKAREEERERIKKAVEDKLELLTNEEGLVGNRGMSLGVFWFDLSSILTPDHSELDQDKT